jgi:hypothetical protein
MSEKKKYVDLIQLTKDAVDKIKAPFIARKNKLSLESSINDIELKISEAELSVQELKGSKDVVWSKVLDALDKKALLDRQLIQMKELHEELF